MDKFLYGQFGNKNLLRLPTRIRRLVVSLLLYKALCKFLIKQVRIKFTKFSRKINNTREIGWKIVKTKQFILSMQAYNRYAVQQCRMTLSFLVEQGITSVSIYGANDIAEILCILSYEFQIKIRAIYDECAKAKPHGAPLLPLSTCQNNQEVIIVAAVIGVSEKITRLSRFGFNRDNFILMGR